MAPKDSRRQSSNQAGSKTSRSNAPTTDGQESSREPVSSFTPRSIVCDFDGKTKLKDLTSDDPGCDDGSEQQQRSMSKSRVHDVARDHGDRHQQKTTGTHDFHESWGETQHFALAPPGNRHQQPGHGSQKTKAEVTYENLPARSRMQAPSRYLPAITPMPMPGAAAPSVHICLSQLALLFSQIGVIDFENCGKFIQEQPAILKEDERHFRCQAALAYDIGDKQYARACVHRALMINKCSKLDAGEVLEYLHHLTGGSKSVLKHFMGDLDGTYDHMKENIGPLVTAGRRIVPQLAPREQKLQANRPNEQPSTSLRRPSINTRHISTSPDMDENFVNLNITRGKDDQNLDPRVVEFTSDRHRRSQGAINSRGGSGYQESQASVGPGEYTYRGTQRELETLDTRYKQQKDPARFFCVGKVFAILWHENVGQSNRDLEPNVITSQGRFGVRIFSHIRRMIVIRHRYGYCWCVGINTYGKRGIATKRMSASEAKAHAIAHDSKEDPLCLEGEEAIVKEPIAIDMNPGHTLEIASRLNFAKVFTVEHNVKVMPLGKVAANSLPYVQAYWANELSS